MSKIAQLETRKEALRRQIKLRDQILRLKQNPDYQAVVLDGFTRDECARNAHISTDTRMPKEDREEALGCSQAAGYFLRYLSANIQMGYTAEDEIEQIDEAIDEIRQSGEDESEE